MIFTKTIVGFENQSKKSAYLRRLADFLITFMKKL
nr:MAG TPA: hypothetical protein [Crassvirales sp.]